MTRYVLKNDGYPTFKKIMVGRKWVGRVCKTTTGYLGLIGPTQYKATTEKAAFDGVIAKHCGFASPADMDATNREVRAINRAQSARARHVVDEMIQGNFEPLDRMLGWSKNKGEQ